MKESEIQNYTENELFSDGVFAELYSINAPHIRARVKNLLKARAKELGVLTDFKEVLQAYDIDEKNEKENALGLALTKTGTFKSTIDNFLKIIENDTEISDNLIYNSFKNVMEYKEGDTIRPWTDSDDSRIKSFIEKKYGIESKNKYDDAMRIFIDSHSYNPLKDYIDSLIWDGKSRIEEFLSTWTKCGNTPYTREASRLLFAGGIARLYSPGCKQEDVITLTGGQGVGKTSLVRWLALEDKYYDDISEFKDEATAQKIQGIWICELGELAAVKKAKDQETVKAFISRQNDRYRSPYDRHVGDHPRQTFFVATANNPFFLSDFSGGRRFYPINCNCDAPSLYAHEETLKKYIRQCWAEAREKYLQGDLNPFPNPQLIPIIREAQAGAMEEDWMKDAIIDYIEDKMKICIMEVWHSGLGNPEWVKPKKPESNKIAQILLNTGEWERTGNVEKIKPYGRVRTWKRTCWNKNDDRLNALFNAMEV